MSKGTLLKNISGLLIFQIANFEFCTDLRMVTGIVKPEEVKTNLDSATDLSFTFLNQEYILIDFSNLYSLQVSRNSDSSRVIFLEIFDKTISFYVDRVIEIISLDEIFIKNSIDLQPSPEINYTRSVMSIQGRKYYFPDYERIAKEVRMNELEVKEFYPG